MPVELHIRRWPENSDGPIPISLDEWKVAVEQCENTRLCTEEYWINPVTQKRMEYKVKEGDVEVFDGFYWILSIYWASFDGSAFFNGRTIEDWHPQDLMLGTAISLCKILRDFQEINDPENPNRRSQITRGDRK